MQSLARACKTCILAHYPHEIYLSLQSSFRNTFNCELRACYNLWYPTYAEIRLANRENEFFAVNLQTYQLPLTAVGTLFLILPYSA